MNTRPFRDSDFVDLLRMSAALSLGHGPEELTPWMQQYQVRDEVERAVRYRKPLDGFDRGAA